MRKIFINISLAIILAISMTACVSTEDSNYKNSKPVTRQNTNSSLPHVGNGSFSGLNIPEGQDTGSFVGQKIASFRNELSTLQDSVNKHNADLQSIRNEINNSALKYDESIQNVENRLKTGTTPGNPLAVAELQTAQANAQELNSYNIRLNQLSTRVSSDIVKNTYVTNSIKSTFFVSGAYDEDHSQLKVLQEVSETTNKNLNSMFNEITNDYNNIQEYTNTASQRVKDLYDPVSRGSFSGGYTSMTTSATPTTPVVSQNINNRPSQTKSTSNEPKMAGEDGFSSRPLFTVKFNKANVNYKEGLNRAVTSALKAKPDMLFDVVAVAPGSSSMTDRVKSREYATKIFEDLVRAGVNPANISLSAKSNPAEKSPEVQIYVK